MNKDVKIICIGFFLLLSGCVSTNAGPRLENNGVRNFCFETVCNSLENSGSHYQRKQQGSFIDLD